VRISIQRLEAKAEATGFRAEVLEKVIHLLHVLGTIQTHPFLLRTTGAQGRNGVEPVLVRSAARRDDDGEAEARRRSPRCLRWRRLFGNAGSN